MKTPTMAYKLVQGLTGGYLVECDANDPDALK